MAQSWENKDYELVEPEEAGSSQRASSDDNIGTKPTWKLPPKPLLPRSQANLAQSITIKTLVMAYSLAACLVLLIQLRLLLPDIKIDHGAILLSNDTNMSVRRVPTSPISCDLLTANAGVLEKAFTIDLRSQLHLSFATAKFIDVVWDLVIGQGGRLLLAWISYVVFMDGLARLMETSSISFQLYASIVFETSSLISVWYSLKAISTGHGWRGRAFLAWFGLAIMYVLGYSTLMSAATGYLNPSTIRYRVGDDTLIQPYSDEITHCLRIMHAPAGGLDEGYIVQGPSDKELDQSVHTNSLRSKYQFFYMLYWKGRGESLIDIFSLFTSNI